MTLLTAAAFAATTASPPALRKNGDIETAEKIMNILTEKDVARLEDMHLSPVEVKELRLEILARLDETKAVPPRPATPRHFKLITLNTTYTPASKDDLGFKDVNFHYELQFDGGATHFILISVRHSGQGQLNYGIAARAASAGEEGMNSALGAPDGASGGNAAAGAGLTDFTSGFRTSPSQTLRYVNRWAFLLFGFLCAIFILAMAYQCCRRCFSGHPKEILWLPFIFVAAFRIDMNWSDVSLRVLPAQLVMLGVQARQAGPFGPWIFSAALPVGALLYLVVLRRRQAAKLLK